MKLAQVTRGLAMAAGLFLGVSSAHAAAPAARLAVLDRGINITHWFRFVPRRDATAMAAYMDPQGLARLKATGFTYVRLAVGPEEVMDGQRIAPHRLAALLTAIGRIEQAGLGVMIEPHPELIQHWNLQNNQQARETLLAFWHDLAPKLRRFSPALTFPELVNEPSLNDPAQWDMLQQKLLAEIRSALPDDTVILTGTNWSSIDGLLKVHPVGDPDVIYSFHSYEPQLLALLGFWDPAINKKQLAASIPFPAGDPARCKSEIAPITDPHTHAVADYWCSLHQDDASITRNLARAVNWGHQHGVSVALTEFGATSELNSHARIAYFSAVRRAADKLHLPWALWGLDDQMGLGETQGSFASPHQISPAVLKALALKS